MFGASYEHGNSTSSMAANDGNNPVVEQHQNIASILPPMSGIEYLGTAALIHEVLQQKNGGNNLSHLSPAVFPEFYELCKLLNVPLVIPRNDVDTTNNQSKIQESRPEIYDFIEPQNSYAASPAFVENQTQNSTNEASFSSFVCVKSLADVLATKPEIRVINSENSHEFHVCPKSEPKTVEKCEFQFDFDPFSIYDEENVEISDASDKEENLNEKEEIDFDSENFSFAEFNVESKPDGRKIKFDKDFFDRKIRIERMMQRICRRKDDRLKNERKFFQNAFKQKRKNKFKTVSNETSRNDCVNVCNNLTEFKIGPDFGRFPIKSYLYKSPDLVKIRRSNLEFSKVSLLRDDDVDVSPKKKKFQNIGRVQQHVCHELKDVSFCLECAESRYTTSDTDYCRFMDFRKLYRTDNRLFASGFVCYDDRCRSDKALHLEFLPPTTSTKTWTIETASFILQNIYYPFKTLLERERKFLNDALVWNFVESKTQRLPFREAFNVRELCDVCSTTIFNLHVICNNCGLAVCIDCVYARVRHETRREFPLRNQDQFGWWFCSSKRKRMHRPTDLRLAQLLPDSDSRILSTLETLNDRANVQLKRLSNEKRRTKEILEKNNCPLETKSLHPSCWFMFDGAILVLKNPTNPNNLTSFQKYWPKAVPVLVQHVAQNLNRSLWEPMVMKQKCLGQTSKGSIVDCRSNSVVENFDVVDFWDGFVDCHKRLTDSLDRRLYLKLKDWPPAEKFSNVLPDHFDDFCKSLPIPEYTHPRSGALNLATNLASFCLEPDLGPKMYTAYEMIFEPLKGTTNLHMDVSCAVNVLVSVTTPANVNRNYVYESIFRHLETQGLDPADFERAKRNLSQVGALWTIFRPEDSDAIRDFLRELAEEQRKNDVDDPIHDQMCYLHAELRKRLENERGVKGFTFVQMLGDAVFIPAGAAHQVQNLLCCIKVAEDFVSPEAISRCATIAGEFRNLTKQHSNHEDKLQLPNIVLHSVREAVGMLEIIDANN